MNPKLAAFIKRNRKRNRHLYNPEMVQGKDYVVCPISGERLVMIKNNYISQILGMRPDEYPDVKRVCDRRIDNIRQGLHQIDAETGLTKYEQGQIKARQTLSRLDQNGLSGYAKKGQKTRSTHMGKIDDHGRNGYARLAAKAIIKGNLTKAEKGIITHPWQRDAYYRYKTLVLHLTNHHRADLTQGYITGLAGKPGAWHIDHRFSIMQGFKDQISPFVIGHRANLQMLPWKQNIQKLHRCAVTKDELLDQTGYDQQRNRIEFEVIAKFIQEDADQGIPPNAAYLLERFYASDIRQQL